MPKPGDTILPCDMKLRDTVRLKCENGSPPRKYADATVYKLTDDNVHLYRPFVYTGDIEFAGPCVSHYIGIEDYTVPRTQYAEYILVQRETPPV